MDLNKRLRLLEKQKPMSTIKLGLERVREVALALDLLTLEPKVITVAGTNGKGSTLAALEQLLLSHGQRVGKYTSPHLIHFNERICINAQNATDDLILKAFDKLASIKASNSLTYYEWVTLVALLIFKNEPLDFILLEVGLGGRLDAVNIIDADIALITSIDFDHTELLGNTLDLIAYEKAGIFRENQQVFSSEIKPPNSLLLEAKKKNVIYHQLTADYTYKINATSWQFIGKEVILKHLPLSSLHLNNISNALACFLSLAIKFSEQSIANSLSLIHLPGRCQWINSDYPLLFDVAHNAQSIKNLVKILSDLPQKPLLVFSMLKGKEITTCIKLLKPYVKFWFIAPLNSPRSMSIHALENELEGLHSNSFLSVSSAFTAAKKTQLKSQVLVVAGSFLTVSEVLGNG